MKNSIKLMFGALAFFASTSLFAAEYEHKPDVAEYQGASWDNLIKVEHGITVEKAKEIADSDPNISYFFFTKGFNLVLRTPNGLQRFGHGDAAFFSGEPWWGSAPGLADGYIKLP